MKCKYVMMFCGLILVIGLLLSGCNCESTSTSVNVEDTTWKLESYGPQDSLNEVLADTEVTVKFDSTDKNVTGSGGCNNYSGSYELSGNTLTFPGPLASTAMSCGEEKDQQEQNFFKIMQSAQSYQISSEKLTINCGDNVLVFNPE